MENLNSLVKKENTEATCNNIKDITSNHSNLPNQCLKETANTIIYAKDELVTTFENKASKKTVQAEDIKRELAEPNIQSNCYLNNSNQIIKIENKDIDNFTNNLFQVNYSSINKSNPDIVNELRSNSNQVSNLNDGFVSYINSNGMLNNPPMSKYLLNKFTQNKEFHNTGRWTQNEHFRFIKGCLLFGNNWKKVSA